MPESSYGHLFYNRIMRSGYGLSSRFVWSASVDLSDYEELMNQIHLSYRQAKYEDEIDKAISLQAEGQYREARLAVNEALKYEETTEGYLLEIKLYLAEADESNWFFMWEINYVQEKILEQGKIPEELSRQINENSSKYEVFIERLKANIAADTKEKPVDYFTSDGRLRFLTDNCGMNPLMYLILYGREISDDALTQGNKEKLIKIQNDFGDTVLELAALNTFNFYYNQRRSLDQEFLKKKSHLKGNEC